MFRFAIIGTSFISDWFAESAKMTDGALSYCVYSRSAEKGRSFADKHGIGVVYTDLHEMLNDKNVDCVYIASPNSFHFSQAILSLKAGKHVLCEKPSFTNEYQLEEVIKTARSNGLMFMEAYKSVFLPGMKLISDNISKLGTIRNVSFSYGRYSSRYDAHKAGADVNTFKKEFSNGALVDMGMYCLYSAVHLFGIPENMKCFATILENGGVDGEGNIIMKYDTFTASLAYSKVSDLLLDSQISGENATMLIDRIYIPQKIEICFRNGEKEILSAQQNENEMIYEIEEFVKCIKDKKTESEIMTHEFSLSCLKLLDSARKQIGLIYPDDKNHI